MISRETLQIIPADGWLAIFLLSEAPWWVGRRLACWALEKMTDEDGEFSYVMGMEGFDALADASCARGFYGYLHERDLTDDLRSEFRARGKKSHEEKDGSR